LKGRLQTRLNPAETCGIYNSYDVVGDIAIIKVPDGKLETAKKASDVVMAVYRNLKAVYLQTSRIEGDFRTRQLVHLAGDNTAVTYHKESHCVFKVDVEKCYFSPRLLNERARIAKLVTDGEVIVNMFAGVGCFSILSAKNKNVKVYSIDVNPTAVEYMHENVRINRVFGKVFPLLGDSQDIVISKLQAVADRVLMPLPEKALAYLPAAVSALKSSGGWIHYYDFEHAPNGEDPNEKTKRKVASKLDESGIKYNFDFSRIIRSTGPNWYQTVLDIHVKA
jgi:tRNA (guanine37-N1)-methyltransferase